MFCSSLLQATVRASAHRGSTFRLVSLSAGPSAFKYASMGQQRVFLSTQQSSGDVRALVERDHFMKVRAKLESDSRKKITYEEYTKICSEAGLSADQAEQLCKSLTDTGLILHFRESPNKVLRDTVYLKPVDFNKTVSRILSQLSDNTFLQSEYEEGQKKLGELNMQLAPLQIQRDELEKKANRRANVIIISGLVYCVVQAAAVARLTWWELSWDVMEPVTYMLTFATALIGYSFFVLTGSEYTYEGLKNTLRSRRLSKLEKRAGFSETQFQKLKHAISLQEDDLARIANDMKDHPAHTILVNKKPLQINIDTEVPKEKTA